MREHKGSASLTQTKKGHETMGKATTVYRAAEILGIPYGRIYRLINADAISTVKNTDGTIVVDVDQCRVELAKRNKLGPKGPPRGRARPKKVPGKRCHWSPLQLGKVRELLKLGRTPEQIAYHLVKQGIRPGATHATVAEVIRRHRIGTRTKRQRKDPQRVLPLAAPKPSRNGEGKISIVVNGATVIVDSVEQAAQLLKGLS